MNVPKRYRKAWRRPWRKRSRHNPAFKRWLRRNGYLSPNFTKAEASGRHRHSLGTDVPRGKKTRNAQRHAFNLERLRHKIGDRPIPIGSWYRNPRHNAAVGGASQSRHMEGDATDHFTPLPSGFDSAAQRVFRSNGFGIYPSGSRHTDSRGWRARW